MRSTSTPTCCIAGGGPAGMMLGYLLARAGVSVLVLEKHEDFLRDFRGDTVHPSTLEILYELGLVDEFLERPHTKVFELRGVINGKAVGIADFRHLPTHCKFIALMPQWDFLDFLASKARKFPTFELRMNTRVVDLIQDDAGVAGVVVETGARRQEIRCDLVVAADGRNSTVREKAGLEIREYGSPIDVLWLRVGKEGEVRQGIGHIAPGKIVVTIDRGDYWQVAYVIPKNGIARVKQRGLDKLRADLVALAPHLKTHSADIRSWDDVRLLTVRIDRLKTWYTRGLLCIGDAAHAMSPIGGIGINLAIQDAVAAANLLADPLRARRLRESHLRQVQKRREMPTRWIQRGQVFVQDRVISNVLAAHEVDGGVKSVTNAARLDVPPASDEPFGVPLFARMLDRWPRLRRIPARVVGLGIRPEHVRRANALNPT